MKKFLAEHQEVTSFIYPAGHGFNCDQRGSYHADSAKLARTRSLDFFTEAHRLRAVTRLGIDAQGLLVRALPVLGDRLLQIPRIPRRKQADLLQRREVLFGFREVVHHQIRLADVLVRAAVPRVELSARA